MNLIAKDILGRWNLLEYVEDEARILAVENKRRVPGPSF